LYQIAEAEGMEDKQRDEWVREKLKQISEGRVQEVIEKMKIEGSGQHRVERMLGYLERFAECVSYDEYKQAGYPIGSGEVESAIGAIIIGIPLSMD
jgi:hypothetical protein